MRVLHLNPSQPLPRHRKHLNADAMIAAVRTSFEPLPDARQGPVKVSMANAAMSGFAMFSLKDPSLLAFDKRRASGYPNLHSIYKIGTVPCDTQMREILDPLDREHSAFVPGWCGPNLGLNIPASA